MAIDNNPVGRLYNLLSQARQQSINQTSRNAWAAMFQVPATDTGNILQLTAQMIVLLKEAKEAVGQLKGVNPSLYTKHFARIEQAFATYNLEAGWTSFTNYLDEPTMQALELAADLVSHQHPEPLIDQKQLAELLAEVNNLLENVLNSDVDVNLKNVFTECLEKIRRAVVEYRLRGASGLRDALDNSVIILARHKDIVEREAKGNPIASSFFVVLSNLSSLITVGSPLIPLLTPFIAHHLLPAP